MFGYEGLRLEILMWLAFTGGDKWRQHLLLWNAAYLASVGGVPLVESGTTDQIVMAPFRVFGKPLQSIWGRFIGTILYVEMSGYASTLCYIMSHLVWREYFSDNLCPCTIRTLS